MMKHRRPAPAANTVPHVDIPPVTENLQAPLFPRLDGIFRWGSGAMSVAMTFYLVLYHDFGPQEHCFSPVRTDSESCLCEMCIPSHGPCAASQTFVHVLGCKALACSHFFCVCTTRQSLTSRSSPDPALLFGEDGQTVAAGQQGGGRDQGLPAHIVIELISTAAGQCGGRECFAIASQCCLLIQCGLY